MSATVLGDSDDARVLPEKPCLGAEQTPYNAAWSSARQALVF